MPRAALLYNGTCVIAAPDATGSKIFDAMSFCGSTSRCCIYAGSSSSKLEVSHVSELQGLLHVAVSTQQPQP